MKTVEFVKDFRGLHAEGDTKTVDDGNRDHLTRMVSRGFAVDPDAPVAEPPPAGAGADNSEIPAGASPEHDDPEPASQESPDLAGEGTDAEQPDSDV